MTPQNIAIIGAGQLGSRHLQGLKKAQIPMNIYVLDESQEALKICEQRYKEIADNNLIEKIDFTSIWDRIPLTIDIAIVATGSKPRCKIIHELVEKHHCRALILEKFLFPTMHDYNDITELFLKYKIQAWVNCCRRYFSCYQKIRELLINDGPIHFLLEGKNWGLCCNSIHQIDIFSFICGEKHISFESSGIDKIIYESKRPGYIEMTGTIKGITDKGSTLSLSSYSEYTGPNKLLIQSQNHNIEIYEGVNKMIIDGKEELMDIRYQSDLTGKYIEDIIFTHSLPLTSYEESAMLHQQILPHFIDIYNNITGTHHDMCPIT